MRRSRTIRLTAVAVALLLITVQGVAAGFGAFAYSDQARTTDLSASFRVGLLNVGEEPFSVELVPEADNATTVTFEDQAFSLPPSAVTTSPGPGAVHLEGGRYAVPRVIEPRVRIDPSADSRNHTVTLTVIATRPLQEGVGSFQQRVVQEATVRLELYSSSPRIRPAETSGDDDDIFRTDDDGADGRQTDGTAQQDGADGVLSILPGTDDDSPQNNLTQPDQSRSEGSGITGTTLVLAGGIVLVAGYIIVTLL